MPTPVCIRCRRPLERERDDGDDLVLRLDGRPMLQAVRELRRDALDDHQVQLVQALEGAMCPACGRAD